MLRWIVALISACFVMALGVSAYGKTPYAVLQSPIVQSISASHISTLTKSEIRELQASEAPSLPLQSEADTSTANPLLQPVWDDLVVDLPDLYDLPRLLCAGDAFRLRMWDELAVAPHSPSLKRKPKPPRDSYALA